nr:MFS transporter [Bradyrhizobium sp. CCBAU 45389]
MSVFWLALGAFAIGTEGFVIAGLLPAIAGDLSISVSAAGQLVTAYALTYAVGSPVLAVALNNVDRRTVLALALATFIAGNIAAMVASNYALLLASRMLMALGSGLCMPTALAVSVAVASPKGAAVQWRWSPPDSRLRPSSAFPSAISSAAFLAGARPSPWSR